LVVVEAIVMNLKNLEEISDHLVRALSTVGNLWMLSPIEGISQCPVRSDTTASVKLLECLLDD
jgi:hypothetical protein